MGDKKLAFVDVETTGLHSNDRIVSIGLIRTTEAALRSGRAEVESIYLLFDPMKKSHPRAEEVHGWDDWTLRHQDRFSKWAEGLAGFLGEVDAVVAHNAAFDLTFLAREFDAASVSPPELHGECTMLQWSERFPDQSASLSKIAPRLGLARRNAKHDALDDAWLCMAVYAALRGWPVPTDLPPSAAPSNFIAPPPPPDGPLPRRNNIQRTAELKAQQQQVDAQTLATAASGLAALVLHVARADGVFAEQERDVLTLLVRDIASHRNLNADNAPLSEAVGALIDSPSSTEALSAAALSVLADEWERTRLAHWVRLMTYADGEASPAEAAAIAELLEFVRIAKRRS